MKKYQQEILKEKMTDIMLETLKRKPTSVGKHFVIDI